MEVIMVINDNGDNDDNVDGEDDEGMSPPKWPVDTS